jgi:hypothetical protein
MILVTILFAGFFASFFLLWPFFYVAWQWINLVLFPFLHLMWRIGTFEGYTYGDYFDWVVKKFGPKSQESQNE